MTTPEQDLRLQRGLLPAIVFLGVIIAATGPGVVLLIASQDDAKLRSLDAYMLPVLLIGGIVMFLVALCLVVIVFRKLGLASTDYALGLPEGSIRAFIALALVLLFFMMGIYLYSEISSQEGEILTGLSPADAAAISDDRVAFRITRPNGVDVHLNPTPSAGDDVAQQMITTMSTLVVAIASFYFGTSSVQQAFSTTTAGQTALTPSLGIIEPQNMPRQLRRKANGTWEPETIRLRCVPPDARIDTSTEGDEARPVAVDDSGLYTYTPAQPTGPEVTLKFFLLEHKEIVQTIKYGVPPEDAPSAAEAAPAEPPASSDPATGDATTSEDPQPEERLPEKKLPEERLPEEKLPEEQLPQEKPPGGAVPPGQAGSP